jgi:hypothetical protein
MLLALLTDNPCLTFVRCTMFNGSRSANVLLLLAFTLVTAVFTDERGKAGQDSGTARESETSQNQERSGDLAMLTKYAAGYSLKLDKDRPTEMSGEPAFRWSNSLAGTRDAAVFLWMADDRPVALGTIIWYPKVGVFHEFQSMALEPLTAERDGKKVWEPAPPGVKFAPLPDAPRPDATEARRLQQMKSLAGRFRAEVVKGPPVFPAGSIWQLRLLPKPLVRYGGRERVARDGALFALCQDTDPDIFVMLEARGDGADQKWHYAVGPMTGWEAKAWFNDTLVWSQKDSHPANDPKRAYFVVGPVAAP